MYKSVTEQLRRVLVEIYHLQGAQYARFKTNCQRQAIIYKPGDFLRCVRCAAHTPYENSPPICVYNSWFNSAGELLSPRFPIMLLLTFGAPALEELAVPDCFSTPRTCYCCRWRSRAGWGETGVVDSGRRAACRQQRLTSFHICYRRLESVSHHESFVLLLSFNYFLPCFAWYSYLDSMPSPSVIILCFKTDWNGRKYRY